MTNNDSKDLEPSGTNPGDIDVSRERATVVNGFQIDQTKENHTQSLRWDQLEIEVDSSSSISQVWTL